MTGKTIGIVPCALAVEGCAREARGAAAAAKAIGWTPIVVDGKADPVQELAAIDSLVSRKVSAIVLNSINASSVGDGMAKAKAAGIPVFTTFAQDPRPFGGIANVRIQDFQAGEAVGAYIVTHGGGNVVVFTDPTAQELVQRLQGLRAAFARFGGAKIIDTEQIVPSKSGPPEEPVMSALLQRYPKGQIQWIYGGYDFLTTPLVEASLRAGRTEIKAIGYDGNLQNLGFIRNGQIQVASIGYPLEWAGWGAIDEMNRYFNHAPLVSDYGYFQYKLLDKSNLPPAGQSYQGDLNYQSMFLKIWGK